MIYIHKAVIITARAETVSAAERLIDKFITHNQFDYDTDIEIPQIALSPKITDLSRGSHA